MVKPKPYDCNMCSAKNIKDFLVEAGALGAEHAICEDCKLDLGRRIQEGFYQWVLSRRNYSGKKG